MSGYPVKKIDSKYLENSNEFDCLDWEIARALTRRDEKYQQFQLAEIEVATLVRIDGWRRALEAAKKELRK